MKLVSILLETEVNENLFQRIGSYLKTSISKVLSKLKNVLNRLPFGKSTTFTIDISKYVNEDGNAVGFRKHAGTYVEHATALELARAMIKVGLDVRTDISTLQKNTDNAFEIMKQSAEGNRSFMNQLSDKVDAGKVLGAKILQQIKALPDLDFTTFEINQTGNKGEKADLQVKVTKKSLTRIIGFSLKATINTTDLTGQNWILRACARFFAPETFLSADGKYSTTNDNAVIKAFPDFGALHREFEDKMWTAEEYKSYSKQAKAEVLKAVEKYGRWESGDEARSKLYDYYSNTLGMAGVDRGKPSLRAYHYVIKNKFNNDVETYYEFFEKTLDSFAALFQKKLVETEKAGYYWVKSQLGIEEDMEFYAYLSKKVTGGKTGVISTHHSPEFINAVNKLISGELKLTVKKVSRSAIQIFAGDLRLVSMNFYQGFAFNQGYIDKKLAK